MKSTLLSLLNKSIIINDKNNRNHGDSDKNSSGDNSGDKNNNNDNNNEMDSIKTTYL